MLIKVFPKVGILINVVGQKLFSLTQHRLAYSSMRGGWKMLEPLVAIYLQYSHVYINRPVFA